MKKLPTALTVPSSSFRVWLTIAPPPEARAPALGRFFGRPGGGVGVVVDGVSEVAAGVAVTEPSSR